MTKVFEEFLVKINEELGIKEGSVDAEEILRSIYYGYDAPKDSVDRIFALYLIDCHSEALNVDMDKIKESEEYAKSLYRELPEDIKEDFEFIKFISYDNYEREGMSDFVAYFNIINVAKEGRDYTLRDSYANGGWFGAS